MRRRASRTPSPALRPAHARAPFAASSPPPSAAGFYESRRDAVGQTGCKHYILALQRPESVDEAKYMTNRQAVYRIQRPSTGPGRASGMQEIKDVYKQVTRQDVKVGWERQYLQSLTTCMHGPRCKNGAACEVGKRMRTMHLLCGSLLPIWSKLERVLHAHSARKESIKITRVRTDDNKRLVGVCVGGEHVVRRIARAIEEGDAAAAGKAAPNHAPPPSVPAHKLAGGSAHLGAYAQHGPSGSGAGSGGASCSAARDVKPAIAAQAQSPRSVAAAMAGAAALARAGGGANGMPYGAVSASASNVPTARAAHGGAQPSRKDKQPPVLVDLSGDD